MEEKELALENEGKKCDNFLFPSVKEGLTQHDGIHCTTRTELDQNLQR